jgi:non-ribosomal peptide synthetase component E (peptide arylation enzyme)
VNARYSAAPVEEFYRHGHWPHETLREAMPHMKLGEKVCVCVVSDDPRLSLDDLTLFRLEKGVAKQKLPERLILVDELPRNPNGKVQKFKLKELL